MSVKNWISPISLNLGPGFIHVNDISEIAIDKNTLNKHFKIIQNYSLFTSIKNFIKTGKWKRKSCVSFDGDIDTTIGPYVSIKNISNMKKE